MSEVFEPLKTIHRFVAAKVVFGVNALEQIGVEAKQFNTGDTCLIITDPKIVSAGHADKVSKFLKKTLLIML